MAKVPEPIKDVPAEEFGDLPKPTDGGIGARLDATDKKLADIEQLTKAILVVAAISLVGVVVAVCGLVLDQMHYNNQNYKQQLQNEINILKETR